MPYHLPQLLMFAYGKELGVANEREIGIPISASYGHMATNGGPPEHNVDLKLNNIGGVDMKYMALHITIVH